MKEESGGGGGGGGGGGSGAAAAAADARPLVRIVTRRRQRDYHKHGVERACFVIRIRIVTIEHAVRNQVEQSAPV